MVAQSPHMFVATPEPVKRRNGPYVAMPLDRVGLLDSGAL